MVRVRHHVNPLASKYMKPRAQPLPCPAYLGPGARVDVELGCADGQFSVQLAQAHPERFVVGLDIREKVIAGNRRRVQRLGLRNLKFAYVNLNVDMDRVFSDGSVDAFHLLFPDPWFKSRHHKRRVIGEWLLTVLQRQLRPGGELHIASDVYDVALEAMSELEDPEHAGLGFRNRCGPWSFWRGNPYLAQSRREEITQARGRRVWRMRYVLDPAAALSKP